MKNRLNSIFLSIIILVNLVYFLSCKEDNIQNLDTGVIPEELRGLWVRSDLTYYT